MRIKPRKVSSGSEWQGAVGNRTYNLQFGETDRLLQNFELIYPEDLHTLVLTGVQMSENLLRH